jgi:hypothetical protein
MQQISRQTMAIAERLRVKNPKLTLRQAVRRAMWLSEQSQVLSEQIHDLQRDRQGQDSSAANKI